MAAPATDSHDSWALLSARDVISKDETSETGDGVLVTVGVSVEVAVDVGLGDGVSVLVKLGDGVGVCVGLGDGVGEAVTVEEGV